MARGPACTKGSGPKVSKPNPPSRPRRKRSRQRWSKRSLSSRARRCVPRSVRADNGGSVRISHRQAWLAQRRLTMLRLRRSVLSTPGSSEKMIEKALGTQADMVFLDLEDAVAPNQKHEARGKVIEALNQLDWGRKTRAIRMNNLETEYAYQDVIEVVEKAGDHLD